MTEAVWHDYAQFKRRPPRRNGGRGTEITNARSAPTRSATVNALGGSEYVITLDALKSNPKGAHLVMRFAS